MAAQSRADYIYSMLDAFENENPGIAEVLAIYEDSVRHYSGAINAFPSEIWTTTSTQSTDGAW